MDRRDFIRKTLATAATLAAARVSVLAQVSQTPKKIIIVGGGLSGLVAGYELKKLGHNITILEAQSRAGGRVLTLRDFAEGQYADAGAARIPEDHDLTHKYVKEFAIPLIPFYPTTDKFSRFKNGSVQRVDWNDFAQATSAVMGLEQPQHWQKMKGGNDLLPRAFADHLSKVIHYNSPVSRVEQSSKGVTVKFTQNGKLESLSGDLLICAIPLTTLRNIEFSPALPSAKKKVIDTAQYDSASRVFLQTKDRFWLKNGWNGFAFGQNADEIWDATFGENGTHGIIESYTRYGVSKLLTGMQPEARISGTLTSLEKLYPDLSAHFEKGFSKCWSEDPWVKGAWAHLGGGEKTAAMTAEGRIYFAGEHISNNPSWMQGALESGLSVVKQITRTNTMGREFAEARAPAGA